MFGIGMRRSTRRTSTMLDTGMSVEFDDNMYCLIDLKGTCMEVCVFFS